MKHLVICAMGRSGSTLLQGILNSIPGYCIRGENNGLTLHMYRTYRSLILSKIAPHSNATDPTNPFYGAEHYDPGNLATSMRTALYEQLKPPLHTKVLGFKEVRWSEDALNGVNLWNYLRFIKQLLPDCRFVLLTRSTQDMLQSGWWVNSIPQEVVDTVNTFYLLMRNSKSEYFEIDYKSLLEINNEMVRLFEFLGEELKEDVLNSVIAKRHSF